MQQVKHFMNAAFIQHTRTRIHMYPREIFEMNVTVLNEIDNLCQRKSCMMTGFPWNEFWLRGVLDQYE